jgi:polynucleotide 5'-kinase involved in rRNA processing
LAISTKADTSKIRQFLYDIQLWAPKQFFLKCIESTFLKCIESAANFKETTRIVSGPPNSGKSTLLGGFVNNLFTAAIERPDNNES